jgi:hypothetical protein
MSKLFAPKLIVSNRRRALLLLLASLGLVLPLLVIQSASAVSPAPVQIQIDAISSDIAAPAGTPQSSQPTVLVQVGGVIHIDVSFYDADGNPASFNTDTKLSIDSSAGTPSPSTVVVPRNNEFWTLDTSLSTAANQVSLTVSVAGGKGARTVTPGTSSAGQLFDVVAELRTEKSSDNFAQGIGGDANCTDATRQDPVCGIVILPKGAASDVLLSIGACDGTSYTPCSTKGAVVQTLFADGGLYSTTNPATLLMKCDKTRCGTGAIQNTPAYFSTSGNGALEQVPACPAKNTVGEDQKMCVDWVQSKRDGSGDTYLYLLFTHDMRAGVG